MIKLYLVKCLTPLHYYVGITTQSTHRFYNHKSGNGAEYTKVHGVKRIRTIKTFDDEIEAKKAEEKLTKALRKEGYYVAGGSDCRVAENSNYILLERHKVPSSFKISSPEWL